MDEFHGDFWASFTKSQPKIKQLLRKILLPTPIPNSGDLRQPNPPLSKPEQRVLFF